VGRTLEGGPDDEGEKAEETRPPSSLNNIVGNVELSQEEVEQEMRLARARKHLARSLDLFFLSPLLEVSSMVLTELSNSSYMNFRELLFHALGE
jgi:hypothetical protein